MCLGHTKSCRGYTFRFKDKETVLINSFKIKVGDKIKINDVEYTLIERKVGRFEVFDISGEISQFKYEEFPEILEKNKYIEDENQTLH